jgi:hypothetical protein
MERSFTIQPVEYDGDGIDSDANFFIHSNFYFGTKARWRVELR